ncbi:MAG: copper amine oxidase N-terminal domain-containing protein [Dehalococcoidia bacterium]|nr:MAG: copper amine oxidase N-terminal domain-containing protein [Dehalococcoidia bacterium]
MRKLRNLLILLTLIMALFVITAPAIAGSCYAGNQYARSKAPYTVPSVDAKFIVGEASYTANGKTNEMDAKTFIENGRTYVPIRYIAYALGVPESGVVWDEPTKTVQLIRGYNVLKFRVGSKESNFYQAYWGYCPNDNPWYLTYQTEFGGDETYIKKCYKIMDVAPVNRGGRVYLPARYVAEGFGVDVGWDNATRTVTLWQPLRKSSPFPPPAGLKTLGFRMGDGNAYVNCTVKTHVAPSGFTKIDAIEGGTPLALSAAPFMTDEIYLPAVDTLKTLGVPDENLSWDGRTLKMFMYPDYWFEIDAGGNLLKLNGYTMEYCDQIKDELTGDLVKASDLYMINGAVMLDSYDLDDFRAILDGGRTVHDGGMEYLRDKKSGIVFFKKVEA